MSQRRPALDHRRFTPKGADADPREVELIQADVADALRRGAEEPDQNRRVGKMFEDVLDQLHSTSQPSQSPTAAQIDEEEIAEEALLYALRQKVGSALGAQGLILLGAQADGEGNGYYFAARDKEGREFEALFSFADGIQLGADSPIGMVDRITDAVATRIFAARANYHRRALLEPVTSTGGEA